MQKLLKEEQQKLSTKDKELQERSDEVKQCRSEIARLEVVLAAATEQLRVMDGELMAERETHIHIAHPILIVHLFSFSVYYLSFIHFFLSSLVV